MAIKTDGGLLAEELRRRRPAAREVKVRLANGEKFSFPFRGGRIDEDDPRFRLLRSVILEKRGLRR